MNIRIKIGKYVWLHIEKHAFVQVYICKQKLQMKKCSHTDAHTHAHTHTYLHTHTYIHTHAWMHAYTKSLHMNALTHTHTDRYMNR